MYVQHKFVFEVINYNDFNYSSFAFCWYVFCSTGVFHLVEFTDTKTVDVISSSWLVGNNKCCYSTSLDSSKVAQLARRHVPPAIEWQIFDIRIKKTAG